MDALDPFDVAVNCCIITKAPCGGQRAGKSPVDRGREASNARSAAVDADGLPLGIISAPANRHDSPLLDEFYKIPFFEGMLPWWLSPTISTRSPGIYPAPFCALDSGEYTAPEPC
jgi:hypothetical protein